MTYEQKNIAIVDIKTSDYNPRQISANDFIALKESITKFGMAEPLVVNSHKERENVIIGGHQRLRACRELGFKEVPCFVVSLNLDQERELNIRLNRNHGDFDYDVLANQFDVSDLLDWGMTARELDMDLTIDLPDDGEEIDGKAKEEKFEYKMVFNNAGELDAFYDFLSELKLSLDDEDYPTLSQKLLNYIQEHPIQI